MSLAPQNDRLVWRINLKVYFQCLIEHFHCFLSLLNNGFDNTFNILPAFLTSLDLANYTQRVVQICQSILYLFSNRTGNNKLNPLHLIPKVICVQILVYFKGKAMSIENLKSDFIRYHYISSRGLICSVGVSTGKLESIQRLRKIWPINDFCICPNGALGDLFSILSI